MSTRLARQDNAVADVRSGRLSVEEAARLWSVPLWLLRRLLEGDRNTRADERSGQA